MATVRLGDVTFDLATRKLFRNDQEVGLEPKGKALLMALVDAHGECLTYRQIVDRVWEPPSHHIANRDVHHLVRRIRKQFGSNPGITNVKTVGYCLIFPSDALMSDMNSQDRGGQNLGSSPAALANLGWTLEESRLDDLKLDYRTTVAAIDSNLGFQFLLVVTAAALSPWHSAAMPSTASPPSTFMVPVCLGLAGALMYLWLRFGFRLDDLIEWRSDAWAIVLRAQAPKRASAFNDSGFVDGWFMCFRPTEHSIDTKFSLGSKLVFLSVYPTLFAAAHAWTVYLLVVGERIYFENPTHSPIFAVIAWTLPWLAGGALIGSHWQFRAGGDNPNWFQPLTVLLAVLIFVFLMFG